ncbi:MAG: hypothetical protein AB2784_19885, partial [Candidatus Thiodiazotropha endolucinida]
IIKTSREREHNPFNSCASFLIRIMLNWISTHFEFHKPMNRKIICKTNIFISKNLSNQWDLAKVQVMDTSECYHFNVAFGYGVHRDFFL